MLIGTMRIILPIIRAFINFRENIVTNFHVHPRILSSPLQKKQPTKIILFLKQKSDIIKQQLKYETVKTI